MNTTTGRLTPHVPHWLLLRLADPSATVAPGQRYTFGAAVIFADIVSSTPLVEKLETWGPQGVEALEQAFNTIFGMLVGVTRSFGGDVVYFSGDAITSMWPVEGPEDEEARRTAALRACAAALSMQDFMNRLGEMDTPAGPINPAVRLGVGYGSVTLMIVGSAAHQRWVLAGPAIRAAVQAESTAPPNQVRSHPSVLEIVGEAITADETGVLSHLNVAVPPSPVQSPVVDDELLRPFIHPVLASRELSGPEEFVAEFRSVVPMFVRCERSGGRDDVSAWLNAWFQAAQSCISSFGGWLSNIEVGDKGNVMIAQFGAPVAHEDDERRAVACALALQETAASIAPDLHPRIGIARGRLFVGTVGTPDRHAYTLIGDGINLACRLMEMAQPGQIIVSARVRNATTDHFTFRDLGSVRVRGKREAVSLYTVLSARRRRERFIGQYLDHRQRLVGRERELRVAEVVMEQAWSGRGQILTVSGEAGIGKSCLVSELLHRWTSQGGVAVGGACLPFAQETPYLPWREIVAALCGLMGDEDRATQIEQIAHTLARLPAPEGQPDYWTIRSPLLAEVLGLGMEDNDLTRGLQGRSRRDNTFATVQALLQAEAARSPTLVLIEDAHWADDLSLQLTAFLASSMRKDRLLLVLVHRPLPLPTPVLWQMIQRLPHHTPVTLSELTAEDSRALVEDRLGGVRVPDELVLLVFERTQGHPFFTEEIINMFQDMGCIRSEGNSVVFDRQRAAGTSLPDTVQGVVQARVDQLMERNRLTLKVASVIGRLFPYQVLAGIYPVPIEDVELQTHLDVSERLGLTLLERLVPEPEYLFKHTITREVVYESLAFAQRRLLHAAVARWYEEQYADNLEPYYSLLAYHYGQARRREQELHYLLLAADHAMRIHATSEAVRYYERALELLDREREPARTADVLMRLARGVHFVTGRYDQAQEYFRQALALYEQVGDPVQAAEACFEIADRLAVHNLDASLEYTLRGLEYIRDQPDAQCQMIIGYSNVADLQRSRGNYEEAEKALQHALALAQETGNLDGLWRCYRVLSLYHYSRGEKREAFEAGALSVRYIEQAGALVEHQIIALNNQACFAQELGDVEAAIEAGEAGLALARRAGIVSEQVILASTLAGIYNHIGDWDAAERVLDEGLRLLAQHPHPYHEVALYVEAGDTASGRGDWEMAIEHWSRAEAKSRTGTQQIFTAGLRASLAMAWVQRGDLEQAERWASQARALAKERGQQGALAAGWRAQGMIEQARGNWEAGVAAFKRALALARDLDDPVEAARTLLEYGRLLLAAGWVEEGCATLRQAEEQATAVSLFPVAQAAREARGLRINPEVKHRQAN